MSLINLAIVLTRATEELKVRPAKNLNDKNELAGWMTTPFPFYTLNYSIGSVTYSTFLTGIRGDNLVGMYVDTNNQDHGLLYDLQQQTWTGIDFPGAASTVPYGPSFGSYATGIDIVGSYKLPGEQTDQGFLLDTSQPSASQWVTLDYPGATNTIPHSTFNGLVVGNWDVLAVANPDYQTTPLAGNAFIYDNATQSFTTNNAPNALSTTAYGIYNDLIAGGYADSPAVNGVQPEHGYIYDMTAQTWHTYDHPGAVITHFDGITGGEAPGAYTLIGDWLGAAEPGGSPVHPFVLQVQDFVPVNWIDFAISGSETASGNSVYGNTAVGVYTTNPSTGVNGYVATIPCFASGTRIATANGDVAVEDLDRGVLVLTPTGRTQPIQWIGRRTIDCNEVADPRTVWPVCIKAGAFDNRIPRCDLWLSPDHAVYVDGILIPVKHLINQTSIVQLPRDVVTYWHVELPHHDIILAEDLPVESYLETGSGGAFISGHDRVALPPDFTSRIWDAAGCAPLVIVGAALESVRLRLAARWSAACAGP